MDKNLDKDILIPKRIDAPPKYTEEELKIKAKEFKEFLISMGYVKNDKMKALQAVTNQVTACIKFWR